MSTEVENIIIQLDRVKDVTVYGEKGALVLNKDTIPEHKITRNSKDQIICLYFNDLGLSDPKCLLGLEHNCEALETLILEYNYLLTIDLSPLKKCRELRYLTIYSNQLEEINLSPLSSCKKLEYLNLMQNNISEIKISALKSCKKLCTLYLLPSCSQEVFQRHESFSLAYLVYFQMNLFSFSLTCHCIKKKFHFITF